MKYIFHSLILTIQTFFLLRSAIRGRKKGVKKRQSAKKYGAVGKIKEKRRVNTEGEGERWISMQLGVWLDRYPFNNGYLVYME